MHYDLKRLKHKDPEKGELKDLGVQKQLQCEYLDASVEK